MKPAPPVMRNRIPSCLSLLIARPNNRDVTTPVGHTVAHAPLPYNAGSVLAPAPRSVPPTGGTIANMPVHVDLTLPLHPVSVADVLGMVYAGILDEDDHGTRVSGRHRLGSPDDRPGAD